MSLRLGIITACFAGLAWAHQGASGIVLDRMENMVALGKSLKQMHMLARQSRPDMAALEAATDEFAQLASADPQVLFPIGSGGGVSQAAENIWSDWPGFVARYQTMAMRAEDLAAQVKIMRETRAAFDPVILEQGLRAIGESCKSCHAAYRLPD